MEETHVFCNTAKTATSWGAFGWVSDWVGPWALVDRRRDKQKKIIGGGGSENIQT